MHDFEDAGERRKWQTGLMAILEDGCGMTARSALFLDVERCGDDDWTRGLPEADCSPQ